MIGRIKSIFISCAALLVLSVSLLLPACSGFVVLDIPEDATQFDYSLWELDFSDDFDGTELDTTKWKINTMKNDNPAKEGIRRAGYYVDDSDIIFVQDSALVIRTKYKNGKYGEGFYTSWVESSTQKHPQYQTNNDYEGYSTTYGYFEARCIAPPSIGIWSAFWLMPDEGVGMSENDILGTGSDGVEIDVMESPNFSSKINKDVNTHVVHGDGYKNTVSDKSANYRVPNMYTEYHTYGVEWNENEYLFYIDGKLTWRTSHSAGKNKTLGVSKVNEYMILSVEIAGLSDDEGNLIPGKEYNKRGSLVPHWCGNPEDNDKTANYDFKIDYVRVYKKK